MATLAVYTHRFYAILVPFVCRKTGIPCEKDRTPSNVWRIGVSFMIFTLTSKAVARSVYDEKYEVGCVQILVRRLQGIYAVNSWAYVLVEKELQRKK